MMPAVSVIIPVYKVEKYIERCTRSLFEQTLDNMEYIFVNDCTPDQSMEIVKSVLEEYPLRKFQVKILSHERNLGLGEARRTGLQCACGEYIIHCDSDDWVERVMYEKMYEKANKEQADIVCCGYWTEYLKKRISNIDKNKEEKRDALFNININVFYFSVWNKLVHRSLYEKYHILPFAGVNMWEDVGITFRLLYFSKKTVIMSGIFYHYNKQNEGSIVSIQKISSIEEQMRCARYIEEFLWQQDALDEFELVIHYIKFKAKESFLFVKSLRDVERWLAIFPETHADVWKYTNLPWNMRFEAWLVLKGITSLACFLIDTKTKIFMCIRKCFRGN